MVDANDGRRPRHMAYTASRRRGPCVATFYGVDATIASVATPAEDARCIEALGDRRTVVHEEVMSLRERWVQCTGGRGTGRYADRRGGMLTATVALSVRPAELTAAQRSAQDLVKRFGFAHAETLVLPPDCSSVVALSPGPLHALVRRDLDAHVLATLGLLACAHETCARVHRLPSVAANLVARATLAPPFTGPACDLHAAKTVDAFALLYYVVMCEGGDTHTSRFCQAQRGGRKRKLPATTDASADGSGSGSGSWQDTEGGTGTDGTSTYSGTRTGSSSRGTSVFSTDVPPSIRMRNVRFAEMLFEGHAPPSPAVHRGTKRKRRPSDVERPPSAPEGEHRGAFAVPAIPDPTDKVGARMCSLLLPLLRAAATAWYWPAEEGRSTTTTLARTLFDEVVTGSAGESRIPLREVVCSLALANGTHHMRTDAVAALLALLARRAALRATFPPAKFGCMWDASDEAEEKKLAWHVRVAQAAHVFPSQWIPFTAEMSCMVYDALLGPGAAAMCEDSRDVMAILGLFSLSPGSMRRGGTCAPARAKVQPNASAPVSRVGSGSFFCRAARVEATAARSCPVQAEQPDHRHVTDDSTGALADVHDVDGLGCASPRLCGPAVVDDPTSPAGGAKDMFRAAVVERCIGLITGACRCPSTSGCMCADDSDGSACTCECAEAFRRTPGTALYAPDLEHARRAETAACVAAVVFGFEQLAAVRANARDAQDVSVLGKWDTVAAHVGALAAAASVDAGTYVNTAVHPCFTVPARKYAAVGVSSSVVVAGTPSLHKQIRGVGSLHGR